MSAKHPVMTPRRVEVIALVANGYTNAVIGQRLHIQPDTVNDHLRKVYAALGARDRAHAVGLAIRFGYVHPGRVQSRLQPNTRKEQR